MRVYWFGLSALALVAIAPASLAQVIVIVEAKNNTNVSLRAGNSTSVSGWGNFEKELVAAGGTLRFSTKPRMFRGAEGAVELVTEAGERAATVRFNFPYVGNDTGILELAPGFYGYIDHEDEGMSRHVLQVDLRRLTRPPVYLALPRTGVGVVRGRISWDPAHLQVAQSRRTSSSARLQTTLSLAAPNISEMVKRVLEPQGKAPTQFAELDPSEARPDRYNGKQGIFAGTLARTGQLRWLASTETSVDFELYDLPLDVPLRIGLIAKEDLAKRFAPGPSEAVPHPKTLIPPATASPQFSVRLEYASAFRGPLTDSSPRYDSFNLSLQPQWTSEDSGDGSGAISLDPVSAKLQAVAMSRINPNPLRGAGAQRISDKVKGRASKIKDRR